jgi:hypothetical protein
MDKNLITMIKTIKEHIIESQINEHGVPVSVIVGEILHEIEVSDEVDEESPADKIAKLEEELNKLKEQL